MSKTNGRYRLRGWVVVYELWRPGRGWQRLPWPSGDVAQDARTARLASDQAHNLKKTILSKEVKYEQLTTN